jgi:hypothetical protein
MQAKAQSIESILDQHMELYNQTDLVTGHKLFYLRY